jgi:hypothetical protein
MVEHEHTTDDQDDATAGRDDAGDGAGDRVRVGAGLLLFGIALLGDALAEGAIVDRLGGRRLVALLGVASAAAGIGLLGAAGRHSPESTDDEASRGPGPA